jgi:hypothetical protein
MVFISTDIQSDKTYLLLLVTTEDYQFLWIQELRLLMMQEPWTADLVIQ